MKTLITGGCGFIGLAAAHALRQRGHDVRLLSSRRIGEMEGFPVVQGDVRDPESLASATDGIEAVVLSHQFRGFPIERPETHDTFQEVDADGTQNVLVALQANGQPRRIVYLSGAAVQEETRDAHPGIAAKWDAEQHVQNSGIPWTVLRASIVYGPGDHYFSQMAAFIRNGPVVPVFGDGRALAQPIHIDDLASTIAAAVEDAPSESRLLDACGPNALSTNATLDLLMQTLGQRRPVLHLPLPVITAVARVMETLPNPPLTRGLIAFSRFDNTSHGVNADTVYGLAYRTVDSGIRLGYGD